MKFNFSSEIIELLKNSGWNMGRFVDIETVKQRVEEHGFHFNQWAKCILENFYGIAIFKGNDFFRFDPDECLSMEAKNTHLYLNLIGKPISPFAEGRGFHVFVSEDGKFLLLHDAFSGFVLREDLNSCIEFCFHFSEIEYEFVHIDDRFNTVKTVNF